MRKPVKRTKPSAAVRTWDVCLIGGKRAKLIGFVRAADRKGAEEVAIEAYELTDEQRRRLMVTPR